MQVIVRDRRQGKTTELIKWLLQGHMQEGYPQWSRVLVVAASNQAVAYTTHLVHQYISKGYSDSDLCAMSRRPHYSDACDVEHNYTVTQIRKAVWGMSDYLANEPGRDFEFAVDEMQYVWERGYRILREPAIITLTGTTL